MVVLIRNQINQKKLTMKQSVFFFKNLSLVILSFSFFLASCSKNKDMGAASEFGSFAGHYRVVDDNETYTLVVESTGSVNFEIREFGGFLNVPLKAIAAGNSLQ